MSKIFAVKNPDSSNVPLRSEAILKLQNTIAERGVKGLDSYTKTVILNNGTIARCVSDGLYNTVTISDQNDKVLLEKDYKEYTQKVTGMWGDSVGSSPAIGATRIGLLRNVLNDPSFIADPMAPGSWYTDTPDIVLGDSGNIITLTSNSPACVITPILTATDIIVFKEEFDIIFPDETYPYKYGVSDYFFRITYPYVGAYILTEKQESVIIETDSEIDSYIEYTYANGDTVPGAGFYTSFEVQESPCYFGEKLKITETNTVPGTWENDPENNSPLYVLPALADTYITGVFTAEDILLGTVEYERTIQVLPSPVNIILSIDEITYGMPWLTVFESIKVINFTDEISNALLLGYVELKLHGSSDILNTSTVPTAADGGEFVDIFFIASIVSPRTAKQYEDDSLLNQTITINKAIITITVVNKVMSYNDIIPELTYTLSGFVNGETLLTSGVTGIPDLQTAEEITSLTNVGVYRIEATLGTLEADNYTFIFVPGTLTIQTVPVIITPGNLNQTYDGTNKTITATAVPDTPLTFTYKGYPVTGLKNTGNYSILIKPTSSNYSGSVIAVLHINKALGTIIWSGLSQPYTGKYVTLTNRHTFAVTYTVDGVSQGVTYPGQSINVGIDYKEGGYALTATIVDSNYYGTSSAILDINRIPTVLMLSISWFWDFGNTVKDMVQTTVTPNIPGVITFDPTGDSVPSVGSHSITAEFIPNNPNYMSDAAELVAVIRENISVTISVTYPTQVNLTYGDLLTEDNFNAFITAKYPNGNPGPPGLLTTLSIAYNHTVGEKLDAGIHTLTATVTGNGTKVYTASVTILVEARDITVLIPNSTVMYNKVIPPFTYSLVYTDTGNGVNIVLEGLINVLTITVTPKKGHVPGVFPFLITHNFATPNFTFTLKADTVFTITRAPHPPIHINVPNIEIGKAVYNWITVTGLINELGSADYSNLTAFSVNGWAATCASYPMYKCVAKDGNGYVDVYRDFSSIIGALYYYVIGKEVGNYYVEMYQGETQCYEDGYGISNVAQMQEPAPIPPFRITRVDAVSRIVYFTGGVKFLSGDPYIITMYGNNTNARFYTLTIDGVVRGVFPAATKEGVDVWWCQIIALPVGSSMCVAYSTYLDVYDNSADRQHVYVNLVSQLSVPECQYLTYPAYVTGWQFLGVQSCSAFPETSQTRLLSLNPFNQCSWYYVNCPISDEETDAGYEYGTWAYNNISGVITLSFFGQDPFTVTLIYGGGPLSNPYFTAAYCSLLFYMEVL
jgi:hypothetical protein